MNIFKRKMTLVEMVTSIVVTIITILGLVIYVGISSRVVAMIDTSQDENIKRQLEFIKTELITYIDTVQVIMHDNAESAVITQGVLQPEYSIGNIQDYIDEMKVLNHQYAFTLLNYRGDTIYQNNLGHSIDYGQKRWIQELIHQSIDTYTGTSEYKGDYYWTVAVPVEYNKVPEGILLAEIPIDVFYNLNTENSRLEGTQIKLFSGQTELFKVGNVSEGLVFTDELAELGIGMEFTIDESTTLDMLDRLRLTLMLIILAFILIAAFILITVNRKFIILPITGLMKKIDAFMQEGEIKKDDLSVSIYEIEELMTQYDDMARLIVDRETSLIRSEQSLIKKNEKLEYLLNQLESTQSLIIQQEKLASIGRLAAGVAHELNSPIGFVHGNFDILKEYIPTLIAYVNFLKTGEKRESDDFEDIDFILEDIPMLLNESDEGFIRVIEIVKNLKEYSRIDEQKNQTYDLNKGVETTLMVSKNEYKYIARIDTDLADIPTVRANGNEINEVLLNIIVNAAQAMDTLDSEREKIIAIKTYTDDYFVCCDISDSGPGISDEVIDKIFDPFFTTKAPGKGTGLGLNIAYNIIKNKHEGDLLVSSIFGQGTTFTIKLPK